MRKRSLQSLGFSLLALAGCSLDQYSFNGRDGAVVMDALTVDAMSVDALSNEAAVTDVGAFDADALDASLDAAPLDARDAAIQAPDASLPDAMIACDPAELVPDNAVYVDSTVATSGDGGSFNPLKTITEAVAMVERGAVDRPIVLAPGIYDGPSPLGVITLDSATRALRIVGGFSRSGGSWSRSCTMSIESWILGGNVNQALFIGPSSQPVTIERVAVRTRGNPPPGVSQYAIWIGSTRTVTLRSVDVLASRGGDGVPTATSASGTGVVACNRTTCDTSASAGMQGPAVANGTRAMTPGRLSSTMGFVPSNGSPGVVGAAGFSGRPGTVGMPRTASCALCVGDVCGDSRCDGTACGARMQRQCIMQMRTLTASAGQCGCGGNGGGGGAGGEGGRAAIALYVAGAANVVVEDSLLASGAGGVGAAGAVGGLGAAGQGPIAGETQSCDTQCAPGWWVCNCTTVSTSAVSATPGTPASMGGTGGTGGTGGSGAGGSSIVVARVAAATVRLVNTRVMPGPAGMGGTNALGAAVMGESAAERVVP